MAVFRGQRVDALRQTVARGALALPEPMRPQQWLNLLNRLGHPRKTKWNVRIMERYRHGAGVVTYLARWICSHDTGHMWEASSPHLSQRLYVKENQS
jgi:hypothetical protein